MRRILSVLAATGFSVAIAHAVAAPTTVHAQAPASPQAGAAAGQEDPIRALVARLDLEKYKATIKGLTEFGDRRQGTDRNRAANDWIEAQLKSYGCSERGTAQVRVRARSTPDCGRGAGWCRRGCGRRKGRRNGGRRSGGQGTEAGGAGRP